MKLLTRVLATMPLIGLLSGCASILPAQDGSPNYVARLNADELQFESDTILVNAVGWWRYMRKIAPDLDFGPNRNRSAVISELVRRGVIRTDFEQLVRQNRIQLGMNRAELLASWGNPPDWNRSVGPWGVHIQYVYGNSYVYVENGFVTSYQI